jgi:gliding motility-associated-like protein
VIRTNQISVLIFFLFVAGLLRAQSTVTIESPVPSFCSSVPYTFTLSGATALSSSWSAIPQQDVIYSSTQPNLFTCRFTIAGRFNINVRYTDSTGVKTVSRTVIVVPTATAAFNASLVTAGFPNQLLLTNYSQGYLSTRWFFDKPDQSDSSFNTARNYSLPGHYKVQLTAYGKGGCDHSTSYSFYISDSSGLTLPNIFTPNEDGVNDVYRPISRGLTNFSAVIYNRDGVTIWDWQGANGCWDGRTYSGEKCPDGVYFIVVQGVGFDGRKYKEYRHVTLLR